LCVCIVGGIDKGEGQCAEDRRGEEKLLHGGNSFMCVAVAGLVRPCVTKITLGDLVALD
jgi:hypothetical protein